MLTIIASWRLFLSRIAPRVRGSVQQTYNTISSAVKHISVILEDELEWPSFDGVDLDAVQRQAATNIASMLFNDV